MAGHYVSGRRKDSWRDYFGGFCPVCDDVMILRNIFIFSFFSLFLVLSGCGDGKIRELRAEFVEGCRNTGGERSLCICVFEKIEDEYPKEDLLNMKKGVLPKGFPDFIIQSAKVCVAEGH